MALRCFPPFSGFFRRFPAFSAAGLGRFCRRFLQTSSKCVEMCRTPAKPGVRWHLAAHSAIPGSAQDTCWPEHMQYTPPVSHLASNHHRRPCQQRGPAQVAFLKPASVWRGGIGLGCSGTIGLSFSRASFLSCGLLWRRRGLRAKILEAKAGGYTLRGKLLAAWTTAGAPVPLNNAAEKLCGFEIVGPMEFLLTAWVCIFDRCGKLAFICPCVQLASLQKSNVICIRPHLCSLVRIMSIVYHPESSAPDLGSSSTAPPQNVRFHLHCLNPDETQNVFVAEAL